MSLHKPTPIIKRKAIIRKYHFVIEWDKKGFEPKSTRGEYECDEHLLQQHDRQELL